MSTAECHSPHDLDISQQPDQHIDQNEAEEDEEHVTCRHVPARYVLALLGFLGFTVAFSMRTSLSVAVVAMVNATSSQTQESDPYDVDSTNVSDTGQDHEGRVQPASSGRGLDWDETTQGVVLGAYFYSYTLAQMAGGWGAQRLGAKNLLGVGILISSLLAFLLPTAARAAAGYFIAIRVCQGVAESALFPAMNCMWAVWAPIQERGRLVNFTYAGAVGCVWVLLWMLLVHDSPLRHPRLTRQEKALLEDLYVPKKSLDIPWCGFVRSPAVWVVAANHFMVTWGHTSMASMLPTYMANIQHFEIQQNGLLSAVPFFAQWLSLMGGSVLMDTLQDRRWLTTRRSRLLLNGTGGALGAGFYVAMGQVPEQSHVLAVGLTTAAMACAALCVCCLRVAHLDLCPTHAGTLYGITNGLSSSAGFLAPALVGVLTENQQTVAQWWIFFCITASLYLVCPVLFCLFSARGRNFEQPADRKSNEGDKTGSLMKEDPEVS